MSTVRNNLSCCDSNLCGTERDRERWGEGGTLGRKRKDMRKKTQMTQSEGRQGTCAGSIITGVHFGEVSINRDSLC